jgi:hypothetical protein
MMTASGGVTYHYISLQIAKQWKAFPPLRRASRAGMRVLGSQSWKKSTLICHFGQKTLRIQQAIVSFQQVSASFQPGSIPEVLDQNAEYPRCVPLSNLEFEYSVCTRFRAMSIDGSLEPPR